MRAGVGSSHPLCFRARKRQFSVPAEKTHSIRFLTRQARAIGPWPCSHCYVTVRQCYSVCINTISTEASARGVLVRLCVGFFTFFLQFQHKPSAESRLENLLIFPILRWLHQYLSACAPRTSILPELTVNEMLSLVCYISY